MPASSLEPVLQPEPDFYLDHCPDHNYQSFLGENGVEEWLEKLLKTWTANGTSVSFRMYFSESVWHVWCFCSPVTRNPAGF